MIFVVYGAYRVVTTAGREIDLLFRGRDRRRLIFIELDAPYRTIPLRIQHVVSYEPIGADRAERKMRL